MEDIGIADHGFSYGTKAKNIDTARKALHQCDLYISVHCGVESHMLEYRVASIDMQHASHFDYVLMAPNHYHLRGVSLPTNLRHPKKVAPHEVYMFGAAIACPITDAVVHPFVFAPDAFGLSKEELSAFGQEVMRSANQKRLINQLDLASQRALGIEISPKFIQIRSERSR